MTASLSGAELAQIFGPFVALLTVFSGFMVKVALDTRKEAKAVNAAVNNRPAGEPSIYELVRRIDMETMTTSSIVRELVRRTEVLEQWQAVKENDDRTLNVRLQVLENKEHPSD